MILICAHADVGIIHLVNLGDRNRNSQEFSVSNKIDDHKNYIFIIFEKKIYGVDLNCFKTCG